MCAAHTRSFGEWAGDVLGGNEHITYPHRDCQWKIDEHKYRRHTLYSTPYDRTHCAQCTRCCSMQSAYNRQPMLGCQWYSQNSIKFNHISSLFTANITILLQRMICGNNNKIDRGGALRIVAMCGSEQQLMRIETRNAAQYLHFMWIHILWNARTRALAHCTSG